MAIPDYFKKFSTQGTISLGTWLSQDTSEKFRMAVLSIQNEENNNRKELGSLSIT